MLLHLSFQVVVLLFLAFSASVLCQSGWSYAQQPWNLGVCSTGHSQSPIAFVNIPATSQLSPIDFSGYTASGEFTITNKGYTIAVDAFNSASYLRDPNTGVQFQLYEFHFHSPGEHAWGSGVFDMEAHLVHVRTPKFGTPLAQLQGSDILVIGIGFLSTDFSTNPFLNSFWSRLVASGSTDVISPMNVVAAMPESRNYFTYTGSLTTPNCSEGVTWYVMEMPVTLSINEMSQLRSKLGFASNASGEPSGNNRALQPIYSRTVQKFLESPTTPAIAAAGPSGSQTGSAALAILIILLVAGPPVALFLYRDNFCQKVNGVVDGWLAGRRKGRPDTSTATQL